MASTSSPKEFYSLVLEDDPSRAYDCLSNIPLDSRPSYVSFQNEEGAEHLHGQTALHAAARAGHVDLVQLLLDSNSDKDARKANGETPISVASFNGHEKVVEMLLHAGADKDAAMNDGTTPIYIASQNGHEKVVEMLLTAGADKNAANKKGEAPIHVASQIGHQSVVALLLAAGTDKNAASENEATPIYFASRYGHDMLVEMLLAAGADKDAVKSNGATPIFIASFYGHHNVVKLLLVAGVDINAARNDGSTPIYAASQNGHHQVAELLLAAGANMNAAIDNGAIPIHVASFNGHDKVVELLLAAGADKNAARNDGVTPLDIACQRGKQNVVDLLLTAGAQKSASKNDIRIKFASLFRSTAPQPVNDAFLSRQAELLSQIADTRLALRRFNREAPFRSTLDRFQISSSSRNHLFLTHGLELSTLEHLTIDVLKAVLKDNIPHLPTLRIAALYKELLKISLTPLPALPLDFPHLDNLSIPLDNLKIEPTAFAEGADGKVYHADYLGFSVAVKKLTNPDASFRKELEKWCHFRHPNILLLIGFSQPSNSLPLIVMELMDRSLFDLLKNHQINLSWESRLKMAHGIAAGLVYLHEIRNIIHRDIKSLNILVRGRDNEVKIADFGASRGNTSLISNKIAGTPRWLAPELYNDHPPTYAVDIYAFGITLNELSTRKPPFVELGNNFAAIMKAVISNQRPKMEPIPSILSTPSWYSHFVDVIESCWHQDPLQRPSATMAFQALNQMLKQPIPTSSSSSSPSTSSPSSSSPVLPLSSIHYDSNPSFTPGLPPSTSQVDASPLAASPSSVSPHALPYDAYQSNEFSLVSPSHNDVTPLLASPDSPSTSSPLPLVGDWSVRLWLTSIGMENDIVLLFESNELDDREIIRGLNEEDLINLGISMMGRRKKILKFAQLL